MHQSGRPFTAGELLFGYALLLVAVAIVQAMLRRGSFAHSLLGAFLDESGSFAAGALGDRLMHERVWGLSCVVGGVRCGVAWNTLFLALLIGVSVKKQMFIEDSSLHWAAALLLVCYLVLTGAMVDNNPPTPQAFAIKWQAMPNIAYQVEFTTNSTLINWQPLTGYTNHGPAKISATVWDTNASPSAVRRFYRISYRP